MLSVLYFMKTSSRSSHNKYIAEVCDYRINYNIINLPLSMISKTAASNYPPRSKAKQGDWICLKCSNYNYSFRTKCNRCFLQDKCSNQYELSLIGTTHYGEQSFPSVLFLQVDRNGREMSSYEREEEAHQKDFDKQNVQQIDNWPSLQANGKKQTQKMKKNSQNISIMSERLPAQYCKSIKGDQDSEVLASNLSWINKLIA